MAINSDKPAKLYYSIKEVAEEIGVNESSLRYWEKEFPFLKPKVSGNKVRQYTEKDIEQVKLIYNLIKVKASYAAAHYLSDLYKIFDDWSLVIAAYNCGPTNVNKAIHRAKGNADYWNIYPYLPKETRGYVPAFIAANYIMNYYCDHNICPMVSELPVKTDTIVVSKDIHLEQISKVLNINIEHLRNLNPQYRHDIINGLNHPMVLRLPSTLIGSFIDQQDSICAYRADELFLKRATVDVNDAQPTYSRPRSSYSRHSASSRSKKSSKKSSKRDRNRKQGNKSVTIKNGDTLSEIAARHGTTVKKLRKLNGIKGNSIRAGKKIKVK